MPWVYTLKLTQYVDAEKIQADWQAISGGSIANSYGGVTVSGYKAIVVSTPSEPNYADMETTYSYVNSVTEHKEIPNRSGSGWNPPHELAHGIELTE